MRACVSHVVFLLYNRVIPLYTFSLRNISASLLFFCFGFLLGLWIGWLCEVEGDAYSEVYYIRIILWLTCG
jgi:hypothetical protein